MIFTDVSTILSDPEPSALDKYKEEMLRSGLTTSDFEYFSRAYGSNIPSCFV